MKSPNLDPKTLVETQRAYFNTGATRPIEFRMDALRRLKKSILAHEGDIVAASKADMNRPEMETFLMEINICVEEIDFTLKHMSFWVKSKSLRTPIFFFKATSHICPEPLGVSLIISAWNYPFQQLFGPLVGSIAAGNTAVLKPSPDSPCCAEVCKIICDEVFDSQYISTLVGPNEITDTLLSQKLDKIFFTGSPRIGKMVMGKAAQNLIPVTLELGGKCPTIVDEDADVNLAARRVMWGKTFNSGQICVGPDHAFVHESIKSEFVAACKKHVEVFYGTDPLNNPDYCKMINERNFDRVSGYLSGASILFGGKTSKDLKKIEPTLVEVKDSGHPLLNEEIFGPILPILSFSRLDDVLKELKGKEKPLALYYFSNNKERMERVLLETSSGGVTLNDVMVHAGSPYMAFGGVGNSGMGAYHGKTSFDTFSHYKTIMRRANWIDVPFRYPPFGNKLAQVKKLNRFF